MAEDNALMANTRRRILSRKRINAFNLFATAPPTTIDAKYLPCGIPKTKSVLAYWPKAEGNVEASDRERYAVANYNFECAKKSQDGDALQYGTYLIAQIACIFPHIKGGIENALAGEGVEIVWEEVPNDDYDIPELDENVDSTKMAVIIAMTIISLNKNINSVNYEIYTQKRLTALCSMNNLGADAHSSIKATKFRNTMGGCSEIRRIMLDIVVMNNAVQDNAIGRSLGYTYNILSWTEMNAIMFIIETLVLPRSPVLYWPEVAGELRTLYRALLVVLSSRHPQFFMIIASEYERSLLERNNYRTLLAIAHKIRKSQLIRRGYH